MTSVELRERGGKEMRSVPERGVPDGQAVNRLELRAARRNLAAARVGLYVGIFELLEQIFYPRIAVLSITQCLFAIGLLSGFSLRFTKSIEKHKALENPVIPPTETARSVDDVHRLAAAIKDERKPVVYLRPFRADASRRCLALVPSRGGRWRARPIPVTHEEQIFLAFSLVGPVIGLGDPHDRSRFFGAYRIHVAGSAWQHAVLDLMNSARLVVLAPAPGDDADPGLRWEITQARRTVDPERLVVVLVETGSYENFRLQAAPVFPALPATAPPAPAILTFDRHWSPAIHPCSRRISTGPVENGFIRALTPTFDRTGTPWRRYRWKRRIAALIGHLEV
ncbi:MAG: hypothetical protein ACQSGP_02975 [Frankia sp.]